MTSKTAIIVDDSATAQAILKKLLLKHDFQVDTLDSGSEAIDYLSNKIPKLIFLDHIMPGQDGFQILRQLKANPKTASIPVIMYTSQTAAKYANEARALGAIAVLTKQVSDEALTHILDHIYIQEDNEPDLIVKESNNDLKTTLSEIDALNDDLQSGSSHTFRHSDIQNLQKELSTLSKNIQQKIENSSNIHQQLYQKAQEKHPLRAMVFIAIILIPTVFSISFFQKSNYQMKEIEQLKQITNKQSQQLSEASRALTDNMRYHSVKSSQEWDDMLFMLETLIATQEHGSTIKKVNVDDNKDTSPQTTSALERKTTPGSDQ